MKVYILTTESMGEIEVHGAIKHEDIAKKWSKEIPNANYYKFDLDILTKELFPRFKGFTKKLDAINNALRKKKKPKRERRLGWSTTLEEWR